MTTALGARKPTSEQRQAKADHIRIAAIELLHTAATASFKCKTSSALQRFSGSDVSLDFRIREIGKQHTGRDTPALQFSGSTFS